VTTIITKADIDILTCENPLNVRSKSPHSQVIQSKLKSNTDTRKSN